MNRCTPARLHTCTLERLKAVVQGARGPARSHEGGTGAAERPQTGQLQVAEGENSIDTVLSITRIHTVLTSKTIITRSSSSFQSVQDGSLQRCEHSQQPALPRGPGQGGGADGDHQAGQPQPGGGLPAPHPWSSPQVNSLGLFVK